MACKSALFSCPGGYGLGDKLAVEERAEVVKLRHRVRVDSHRLALRRLCIQ